MPINPSPRMFFLSGDEALAQGAYEAGLRVAASYPGTPASEILEYLSQFPEVDAQWSINEKVAYEVALSAAISGQRSLFAAKHVGLNVAMDALMTSAYTGVNAGFVVVSADDPGIHSSQNEQDNRRIAQMAKIPLIEPTSPRESYKFIKIAFEISEKYDTPVLVRITTRIAHTKENIILGRREEVSQKEYKTDIPKYVMVPRNAMQRHLILEKKLIKLETFSNKTSLNQIEIKNKSLGFITSGVSYLYAKEMYPESSFLKLGMSYPFPKDKVRKFAEQIKSIYCLEELEPFIEENLRMLNIKFKTKDATFRTGELRPELIPEIVSGKKKKEEPHTSRKPVMCPGCMHRSIFWLLKKLKLTVTGDIGCYTLGALAPLGSLHTCLCMGASISFFEGFKKSLHKDVVGVIGDSTFIHGGIPALINLSYNKTKGLIIILDNGTTAMTGNQPHPGTGATIKNEKTTQLKLEDICRACGADQVVVMDPFNIKACEMLIKESVNAPVLTVLIARSLCRLNVREKNDPPKFEKEKCKKCYLCTTINCPAIIKTEDGFITINLSTCVGCNLCADVCAFNAITPHV